MPYRSFFSLQRAPFSSEIEPHHPRFGAGTVGGGPPARPLARPFKYELST